MQNTNQKFLLFSYFHKETPISHDKGCAIYIHDFFDSKEDVKEYVQKFVENELLFPELNNEEHKDNPLYGKLWKNAPLICMQTNRIYLLSKKLTNNDTSSFEKIVKIMKHYKIEPNDKIFDDINQYTKNRQKENINQKFEKEPYAMVYMIEDHEYSDQESIDQKENAIIFITSFASQKTCLQEIEKLRETSSLYDRTIHVGLRCVPMRKWFSSNMYCIDYHSIMDMPEYNCVKLEEIEKENTKNNNKNGTYYGTKNKFTKKEDEQMIKDYIIESEKKKELLRTNADFLKMQNEAIKQQFTIDPSKVESIIKKIVNHQNIYLVQDFSSLNEFKKRSSIETQ